LVCRQGTPGAELLLWWPAYSKLPREEDGFPAGDRGLQEQSCCFGGLLTVNSQEEEDGFRAGVNSQEEEDGFRAGDRGLQEQSCCFGGLLTLLLFLCPPCMSFTVGPPPSALPSCCLHYPLAASPALRCLPLPFAVLYCPLFSFVGLCCPPLPSAAFCPPPLHPIF